MREDKLQLQTQVSRCVLISQRAPRVHYLCSTGLTMTWELSLLGAPGGPGRCSEQGGPLSLTGLSPRAWSSQLKMGPRPATLTSDSKPSCPLTLPSPLVTRTGMSATSMFGDHPENNCGTSRCFRAKGASQGKTSAVLTYSGIWEIPRKHSLMPADLVWESKSLGCVFVFHGSRMASGETSSFCVKDRETEGGEKK